jgi:hypothetical protein
MKRVVCICVFIIGVLKIIAQQPLGISKWVYPDKSGKLIYKQTEKGDRIMDFSHAGYMGGGVALPNVPVCYTVNRISGMEDYTDLIQKAIDAVSALPLRDGFRGTVLLGRGEFPCSRSLVIKEDGVVIRGSGTPEDKQSTILMNGEKHTAIVVNKNGINRRKRDDKTEHSRPVKVLDKYIPAGSYSFVVEDASDISVGDRIQIRKMPEIHFVYDESIEYGKKIEDIIERINNEK